MEGTNLKSIIKSLMVTEKKPLSIEEINAKLKAMGQSIKSPNAVDITVKRYANIPIFVRTAKGFYYLRKWFLKKIKDEKLEEDTFKNVLKSVGNYFAGKQLYDITIIIWEEKKPLSKYDIWEKVQKVDLKGDFPNETPMQNIGSLLSVNSQRPIFIAIKDRWGLRTKLEEEFVEDEKLIDDASDEEEEETGDAEGGEDNGEEEFTDKIEEKETEDEQEDSSESNMTDLTDVEEIDEGTKTWISQHKSTLEKIKQVKIPSDRLMFLIDLWHIAQDKDISPDSSGPGYLIEFLDHFHIPHYTKIDANHIYFPNLLAFKRSKLTDSLLDFIITSSALIDTRRLDRVTEKKKQKLKQYYSLDENNRVIGINPNFENELDQQYKIPVGDFAELIIEDESLLKDAREIQNRIKKEFGLTNAQLEALFSNFEPKADQSNENGKTSEQDEDIYEETSEEKDYEHKYPLNQWSRTNQWRGRNEELLVYPFIENGVRKYKTRRFSEKPPTGIEEAKNYFISQISKKGDLFSPEASSIMDACIKLLEQKKQIILTGPPGTGKTYLAYGIANKLTSNDPTKQKFVQFHPEYSYENFIECLRIKSGSGMELEPIPQIFREICELAHTEYKSAIEKTIESKFMELKGEYSKVLKSKIHSPVVSMEDWLKEKIQEDPTITRPPTIEATKFVLIIDEINRGDLSRIFGEVIMGLEYRGIKIPTMYFSDENPLIIPPNLYIIGTMNSVDRSIALVDFALRRRFLFYTVHPNKKCLEEWLDEHQVVIKEKILDLFDRLNSESGWIIGTWKSSQHLAENFKIGHTYFFQKTETEMQVAWEYSIVPLLMEYMNFNKEMVESFQQSFDMKDPFKKSALGS